MKEKKVVLLKDIIIPKGTVLSTAPYNTTRISDDHYDCTIGLSDNTCGYFEYCVDEDLLDELDEYFTYLKE